MKSYKESRLHTAFSDHYLKMKFLWKPRFSINLKSLWTTSSNIRPITSAIMPSASFAFLSTFQGKRSTPRAHTEKTQKPVLQNSSNTSGPRRNKCKCFGTHFSVYFNLVFPLNNTSSPLGRFMEGLNITKEKYYTKMHVLSSPSESLRWGKVIECLIYFAYLD